MHLLAQLSPNATETNLTTYIRRLEDCGILRFLKLDTNQLLRLQCACAVKLMGSEEILSVNVYNSTKTVPIVKRVEDCGILTYVIKHLT